MAKRSLLLDYRDVKAQHAALETIADAPGPDAAWEALEELCFLLGFDYCGVGVVQRRRNQTSVILDHATRHFRRSFDDYVAKGLDRSDPVAARLSRAKQPVMANEFYAAAPQHVVDAAAPHLAHMRSGGFVAHGTAPLRSPDDRGVGVLAFGNLDGGATQDMSARVAQHLSIMRLAAMGYVAHANAQRAHTPLGAPGSEHRVRPILSPREAEVLTLLARGLTPKEIAEHDGKSLATIRQQITSARLRLDARTPAHAVSMAQRLGLIRLS